MAQHRPGTLDMLSPKLFCFCRYPCCVLNNMQDNHRESAAIHGAPLYERFHTSSILTARLAYAENIARLTGA